MSAPAWLDAGGAALLTRVQAFLARGTDAPLDRAARDALALELIAWQRARSLPLDRAMHAMNAPDVIATLDELAGLPTDAFKTARIACFEPAHEIRVFHTSGTTGDVRGQHSFATLDLYDRAAFAAGARWLLPRPPYRFVLLAEREHDAPHSSLTYMLARFAERWSCDANDDPWMLDGGRLDIDRLVATLRDACERRQSVALLGASFAFVHAIDELVSPLLLPRGSVVMPTGGFKGRSRELAPDELFAAVEHAFGVTRSQIVQEYGMTELSSQAYEAHPDGVLAGRYVAPPWMIVTAMDPVTLAPLPHGAHGVLRVIDLANVGSCIAIQTADVGVTHDDGFEVLGRSPGATPRGCARAIDALLSGAR